MVLDASALRLKVVLLYSLSGHMEDRGALILLMRSLFGVILYLREDRKWCREEGRIWLGNNNKFTFHKQWFCLFKVHHDCIFLYDTKSIICSLVCRSGIVCCTCFSLTSVSCSVMWFWSRSSILCVGPTWPPCRPYLRPRRALKRRSADRWGIGLKQYSYRPTLKIKEVCQSHKPV